MRRTLHFSQCMCPACDDLRAALGPPMRRLYKPPVAAGPHRVGDLMVRDGRTWVVLAVYPLLTRYKKAGQSTRVEGYTYGLRAVP